MNRPAAIPEKHGGAPGERLSVRVWLRLLSCTMAIEKEVQRGLAGAFGTTLPRFDILAALERAPGGMTMGELSRALLVSNGNVTGLVRGLAAEGMVEVAPLPSDRRATRVRLTPAGAARFAAMAAAHHDWIDALLGGLGEEERRDLHARLGRLKHSLATATGAAADGP
ncbi:MAG: MarR family transcriptional regulator [Alphaproteobacteria bacterium]|nr:MarR family transcriptional regulator [Alphaproteobacteria bacterium]